MNIVWKKWIIACVTVLFVAGGIAAAANLGGSEAPQPTIPMNPTTQPTHQTEPSQAPSEPEQPTVPTTVPPAEPTEPWPTEPSVSPTEPTEPIVHEHNYVSETIDATCEEGGYTRHTCECGESYRDSETDVLGHDYSEWVTVQEATTEAEGRRERTCSRCKSVEAEDIPKLTGCQHTYKETVVAATCTEKGYTEYVCSECGDRYKDSYVDALGHAYKDKVTMPTCEKDGYTTHTCSKCGDSHKDSYVDALGHSYEPYVTKPTCDKEGYTTHTCEICGDKQTDSKTTALGHKWSEWEETEKPTTSKVGQKTRYCSVCGGKETAEIPKHVHTYTDEWVEPTCTDAGYTLHTCTCGKTYMSGGVDPLGHDWSDWEMIVEPTTESTGERKRDCSRCQETAQELVPSLDPETGKAYEQFIDPRITVEKVNSVTSYKLDRLSVRDFRAWGDAPSIWVNEDGSLTVVYFQQDGTRVEVFVETPPDGYNIACIIKANGTYRLSLTGSYGG